MTIKGSLLNSVLGQDRFQGNVFTAPLEMQEERRSYTCFGVTTFGLFFSRLFEMQINNSERDSYSSS